MDPLMRVVDAHAHVQELSRENRHCHVCHSKDTADLHIVIAQTCVSDPESVKEQLAFCAETHWCFMGIGVHPQSVTKAIIQARKNGLESESKDLGESVAEKLLAAFDQAWKANKSNPKVVCIGECGLDFSREQKMDPDVQRAQRKVFAHLLGVACRENVALNVHSCCAGKYAVDMLVELRVPGNLVLLHAFDGGKKALKRALALSCESFDSLGTKLGSEKRTKSGCFFSIAPIVYRSAHFADLLKDIPRDRVLVETDAPALGRVRGDTNKLCALHEVVDFVANAWGESAMAVAEQLWSNTKVWLGVGFPPAK